jgi:glycosyltransferase involved in cell wall biosynthesis
MIIVCEIMFNGGTHVPFNAGLLASIRAAFPKEDLSFFGGAAHLEELKEQVGQPLGSSIAWSEILPIPPGTSYCVRFFRELSIIRRLLRALPQVSTSRLLFTSAVPSTVLALKAARCFRPKNTPVQMVLHGLNGVVGKRYRRPIHRFQDMKTALTLLGNNGIQYLVLEESIRDTVVKNLPHLSGKIEAFEHPISPNEGASQTVDLSEPIRFGFLGFAIKIKGYPLFVKLANEVSAKYGQRAEFHVIGHLPVDGTPVNGTKALATKPAGMRLTRANFIRGVTPLHFIVLPHEATPYTLTASGVLLDAIAWEKPVIARKIPIFEEIFEKYGDIGHLFSDDTELRNIVEQILQAADKSRYRRQVLNLRRLRKSRSPEVLAAAFREMCRTSEGVLR